MPSKTVKEMQYRFEKEKIIPTLIVGLIILFFGVLLPRVNQAISPGKALSGDSVIDVGLGVHFKPAEGWNMNTDLSSPGDSENAGYIGISKAGMIFNVKVEKFEGSLESYQQLIWDRFNKTIYKSFSGLLIREITTDQGLPGLFQAYYGNGTQGQITAIVENGIGISFFASGSDGLYFRHFVEIRDMVKSLVLKAGGGDSNG